VIEPKGRGVLDTRWSLSSGGHLADPLAGMTRSGWRIVRHPPLRFYCPGNFPTLISITA
jgi:hypothetical protein